MKPQFISFYNRADTAISSLGDRGRIIGTAVALAASRLVSIPSAPVDAPSTHYNFTVLPQVMELIAGFNEQVVFDVKHALAQVREFWFLRYHAVHPCGQVIIDLDLGFYDNLLGVAEWVDGDSHQFNNEHKVEILALAQLAFDLMNGAV
ncbi:hypothetical protein AWB81_04246 [Caballeronia arationis]|uniref:hypothetical protein n=1 Tax=Caballeronia arationis TaxID=1777142 RepID=UPI00074B76FB|nr:hypothetical protein [Caballeronia arationis]SAK83869.1 hypothetical protein AWB81_04246 [Caballeronia arationis]